MYAAWLGVKGMAMSFSFACSGVRQALRLLQHRQAVTTLFQLSGPPRLKRVFGIEIDTCQRCGGKPEIIASIEDPHVIATILSHLEKTAAEQAQPERPGPASVPGNITARRGIRGRSELRVRGIG